MCVTQKTLPEVSNKIQEAMKHGCDNEINAVATITGKILPVYWPSYLSMKKDAFLLKKMATYSW